MATTNGPPVSPRRRFSLMPGMKNGMLATIQPSMMPRKIDPCILFNEKGYFDSLTSFFSHMVKEGFFTQGDFEKILFSNDLQEIESFIEHYQPPALRTY